MHKHLNIFDYVRLIPFIFIVLQFPSGGVLVFNNSLIGFWVLGFVFTFVSVFIKLSVEDKRVVPTWGYSLFVSIASGTWVGLSFGSALILGEWYSTKNGDQNEPLFVATTVASAGIAYLHKIVKRLEELSNET